MNWKQAATRKKAEGYQKKCKMSPVILHNEARCQLKGLPFKIKSLPGFAMWTVCYKVSLKSLCVCITAIHIVTSYFPHFSLHVLKRAIPSTKAQLFVLLIWIFLSGDIEWWWLLFWWRRCLWYVIWYPGEKKYAYQIIFSRLSRFARRTIMATVIMWQTSHDWDMNCINLPHALCLCWPFAQGLTLFVYVWLNHLMVLLCHRRVANSQLRMNHADIILRVYLALSKCGYKCLHQKTFDQSSYSKEHVSLFFRNVLMTMIRFCDGLDLLLIPKWLCYCCRLLL